MSRASGTYRIVASSLRAGHQEPAAMRLSPPGVTMRNELSSCSHWE